MIKNKKNVGVIGVGVVGAAVQRGMEELGHNVIVHDIKLNTSIDDIIDTEACFVCVPTPSKDTGECEISTVEEVVSQLSRIGYCGLVCLKSTVFPGTTNALQEKYQLNICFVPEFLRERCAYEDFVDNHDLCIVGTDNTKHFNLVRELHGQYPKKVIQLTEKEAEFCKYFNNAYNATLITFANSFYEICKEFEVEYSNVKNAIVERDHINDIYLDCNESLRGFGGMCLPKDTKALAFVSKERELLVNFFDSVITENSKYKTTVFEGMRKK